jgi:hypothetical protein
MHHAFPLITTIAAAFGLALVRHQVFVGEQELALAMTQHVLANVSADATTP